MKPTTFSKALGENLRNIRTLRRLTVSQVADIVGISPDDVRKYERGERALTVEKMISFAVAVNCSLPSMLEGLDPRMGEQQRLTRELRLLSRNEHGILHYMATEWDGDRKALIISDGVYMAIPPYRRREVIMTLELQKEAALRCGEITEDDLPEDVEYMQEKLGQLYTPGEG